MLCVPLTPAMSRPVLLAAPLHLPSVAWGGSQDSMHRWESQTWQFCVTSPRAPRREMLKKLNGAQSGSTQGRCATQDFPWLTGQSSPSVSQLTVKALHLDRTSDLL